MVFSEGPPEAEFLANCEFLPYSPVYRCLAADQGTVYIAALYWSETQRAH